LEQYFAFRRRLFTLMRFTASRYVRFAATASLIGGLSVGLTSSAHAAIQMFTDQASFEAALTALTPLSSTFLNTFDGGSGSFTPYSATGNGFRYEAAQASDGTVVQFSGLLATSSRNQALIITSKSGNFNAIGGYFYTGNGTGAYQSGTSTTITVTDGVTTASDTYTPFSTTNGSFRGFISDLPITTLTIAAPGSQVPSRYATMDNLRVGSTLAATDAPEPGTLALLTVAGLGMVGIATRKRRK
jgi:hypothetical protein